MNREDIFRRIVEERQRADDKHGNNTLALLARHHPHMANTILGEETGEVSRAILERDNGNLVDELFDVLQVCTAWLESL